MRDERFLPRIVPSAKGVDAKEIPVAPDIYRSAGLVPSAKGGRCPGAYEVGDYCSTHIDDFDHHGSGTGAAEAPGGQSSASSEPPSQSASGSTTTVSIPEPPTRSVSCPTGGLDNGTAGVRVEAIYAYSTSGANNQATMVPYIRKVMGETEYQFFADGEGNAPHARRIRWVTTSPCTLKVSVVGLPAAAFANAGVLAQELDALGFSSKERIYAVFSQEPGPGCQALSPNVQTDPNPDVNRIGNPAVSNDAVLWAFTSPACGTFDAWDSDDGQYPMTHELIHALGAVNNVPGGHWTPGSPHCTDDWDPLCWVGYEYGTITCGIAESDKPDCNDDDYFKTLPGPNDALATYWNTANNRAVYRPPCTATGTGGFGTCGILRRATGGNVTGSASADIVDLTDVGAGGARLRVLAGTASGGYASAFQIITPQNLVWDWDWNRTDLLVGNINGDSYDDIVLVNDRGGHQLRVIATLGTSGTPGVPGTWFNWYEAPPGNTLYWPMPFSRFALADHDGDGDADLLALNGVQQPSGLYAIEAWTLTSDGTKFAWPVLRFPATSSPTDYDWAGLHMAAGDISGDGRADIVFTAPGNLGSTRVRVLVGQSGGGFTGPLNCTLESCGNLPTTPANIQLSLDDVTGDNRADLLVVQKVGAQVSVVARQGLATGKFAVVANGTEVLEGFDLTKIKITTGDAASDGRSDLVIAYDYGDVGVWRLNGLVDGLDPEQYVANPASYAPNIWKWGRAKVS